MFFAHKVTTFKLLVVDITLFLLHIFQVFFFFINLYRLEVSRCKRSCCDGWHETQNNTSTSWRLQVANP